MATWQVQEAKTRLSALIADAQTKGPQIITKHGSKTAVVLSIGEYEALTAPETTPEFKTGKMSPIDVLLNSPPVFKTNEEYEEFLADCMIGRGDTGRPVDDLFTQDEQNKDAAA